MKRMLFCSKSAKNDFKPTYILKRNFYFETEGVLDNSLHFGVSEIINFQKLIGNLDKMTIANLGRQH